MMDSQNTKANKHGLHANYEMAREERRKLLTSAHKYMIDVLGLRLSLEPAAVEEFILDSPSLAAFDNFFAAGGRRTISFVYQESQVPGIECGRAYPGASTDEKTLRLFLAVDLAQIDLTGLCCVFTRKKAHVPLNLERIHETHYVISEGQTDLEAKQATPQTAAQNQTDHLDQQPTSQSATTQYIITATTNSSGTSGVHITKP